MFLTFKVLVLAWSRVWLRSRTYQGLLYEVCFSLQMEVGVGAHIRRGLCLEF